MAPKLFLQCACTTLRSNLSETELNTFLLPTNHKFAASSVFILSVALLATLVTPARNLEVLMSLPSSPYSPSTSFAFSTFWVSLVFISSLQLHCHCSSSSLIFCLGYYNKTLNFPSAKLQLQPTHNITAGITDTDQSVLYPWTSG